ncbi:hypothetical protein F4778DRAFT_756927 [Xylariomycetidae sp. FL2044]|nr:hypothetical protein F4778DRAFT_756927 [Xylariomycetidae sp. FL2044]
MPLFGGGSLFANNNANNQTNSLFGPVPANNNLHPPHRSLFGSDPPPPYEPPPDPAIMTVQQMDALMEPPITDEERDHIVRSIKEIALPAHFYHGNAMGELSRLSKSYPGSRPEMFTDLTGSRREGVIVRHLVKRHWERLGLWNPKWGFAGRDFNSADDYKRWTWWWQAVGEADDLSQLHQKAADLVSRALRLRRNLRRGEHVPDLPRSPPLPGATAAEGEAFLISRPWFVFGLEVAEEKRRRQRLPIDDQNRYPFLPIRQVMEWWEQRGDWRDTYYWVGTVTSWKWRHESPSPEPEDLAPIRRMRDTPLDAASNMGFSRSEIDELEAIELPKLQQPEGTWLHDDEDDEAFLRHFPGEVFDRDARSKKRRDQERMRAVAEGREPPKPYFLNPWFGPPLPSGSLFGSRQELGGQGARPEELVEVSQEPRDDAAEPPQDIALPPPQRQRRPRQRLLQDAVDEIQINNQPLAPLRRSSRVAGTKRAAEPEPSQIDRNKRFKSGNAPLGITRNHIPIQAPSKEKPKSQPKRGRGRPRKETGPTVRSTVVEKEPPSTTATVLEPGTTRRSIPARAPPKEKSQSQPKRGRGRPRKEGSMRSAVEKKTARRNPRAGTQNARMKEPDTTGVPRRRGRPRKGT